MRIRKATDRERTNHIKILRRILPRDLANNERTSEETAKRQAKQQIDSALSSGPISRFFTVLEAGTAIGYLWLLTEEEVVFVADIYMLAPFRNKGYGKGVMKWVESYARKTRAKHISLHVFGDNATAIKLYEKCGYIQTSIKMLKEIT